MTPRRSSHGKGRHRNVEYRRAAERHVPAGPEPSASPIAKQPLDRKSTRLNSSHLVISYAVFCLTKQGSLPVEDLQSTGDLSVLPCSLAGTEVRGQCVVDEGVGEVVTPGGISCFTFFFYTRGAPEDVPTLPLRGLRGS